MAVDAESVEVVLADAVNTALCADLPDDQLTSAACNHRADARSMSRSMAGGPGAHLTWRLGQTLRSADLLQQVSLRHPSAGIALLLLPQESLGFPQEEG